jgi:hypothetical protein
MQATIDKLGLSVNQIKARMNKLGIKTNKKKVREQRRWFAEDVADMMEGICANGYEITAGQYEVSVHMIKKLVCNANRYGFDAYPPRNK